METIDNFYDKVFGKESAMFIGTLWLGMIAKHMDEIRKAEDEAYASNSENKGELILKWLNKLRSLYDNVEFKTDILRYKEEIDFEDFIYDANKQKYISNKIKIKQKEKFSRWFDKIKTKIEIAWRISNDNSTSKLRHDKFHKILLEIGDCQRELYMEIEKKHLIMPPEKEDMKDITKHQWLDRAKKKDLYERDSSGEFS